MQEWIDGISDKLPPLILAIMGGVADFLMSDEHSWSQMLVAMFLAGFTGYLVLLLCIEYKLSQAYTGVVVGISGLSSKGVLSLFQRIFMDRIKAYIKENVKPGEKK